MGTEAWFHFHGDDRSLETSIVEELTLAGIHLSPFEARAPNHHGVLCFPQVSDALLTSLRTLSGTTLGRVLALARQVTVGDCYTTAPPRHWPGVWGRQLPTISKRGSTDGRRLKNWSSRAQFVSCLSAIARPGALS